MHGGCCANNKDCLAVTGGTARTCCRGCHAAGLSCLAVAAMPNKLYSCSNVRAFFASNTKRLNNLILPGLTRKTSKSKSTQKKEIVFLFIFPSKEIYEIVVHQ
jgi:hypothetical protein